MQTIFSKILRKSNQSFFRIKKDSDEWWGLVATIITIAIIYFLEKYGK